MCTGISAHYTLLEQGEHSGKSQFLTLLEVEPQIFVFRALSMEHCFYNNTDISGRWAHTTVLMPDGRILFAGGFGCSDRPLSSTEVFDPYTERKEPGPRMRKNRSFAAAALLNNAIYICGGCPTKQCNGYLSSCERVTADQE